MNQLYSFLSRIEKRRLRTAPYTVRATWGESSSPYKVIMIAALLMGFKKKNFKNGIITLDQIRPFYEKIGKLLVSDFKCKDPQVIQPFWYLGAGQPKIWNLIPVEGSSGKLIQAILKGKQVKSPGVFSDLVAGAELTTPDFDLLSDPIGARCVARFLAGEYLADHPNTGELLSMIEP